LITRSARQRNLSLLMAVAIVEAVSILASPRVREPAETACFGVHARFRRDSERIALAHAEEQERQSLDEAVDERAHAQRRQWLREVVVGFAQQVSCRLLAQHLTWGLCISCCAARAAGNTGLQGLGETLCTLRYLCVIVSPLCAATFSGWAELLARWRLLSAPASRVYKLIRLLDSSGGEVTSLEGRGSADAVAELRKATLVAPIPRPSSLGALALTRPATKGKTPILRELSLSILEGSDPLFICGPAGSGKSSVARALCGLHPLAAGFVKPLQLGSAMYLASWPHIAGETLADHMTYPVPCVQPLSQEVLVRLRAALSAACVEHLSSHLFPPPVNAATAGGVQASHRWQDSLNLDDRQRLAFARLLYQQPRFAVADACGSAMPRPVEAKVVAACLQAGIKLIIISRYRPKELAGTQILEIDGSGGWRLESRRSQTPSAIS